MSSIFTYSFRRKAGRKNSMVGIILQLFLCLFMLGNLSAQSGVILTEVEYPENLEEFTICHSEGGEFIFSLGGLNEPTDVWLEFSFSPGVTYMPNTLSPAPIEQDISDLSKPRFKISDFAETELRDLTLRLHMDCSTLVYLQSGDNEANINLSISSEGALNEFSTGLPPFTPFTNSVKIPFITILPIDNITPPPIVGLGDEFVRSFEIRETGVKARLEQFTLCMDYQPGLEISEQTFNDVPVSLYNDCITIDASNAADFGISLPFTEGDRYVWSEKVEAKECSDLGSILNVSWGCGNEECQNFTLDVGVEINNSPTIFETISTTRTLQECPEDGALIEAGWTLEEGSPQELRIRLFAEGVSTFIDPESVEISIGDGFFVVPRSTFYSTVFPSTFNTCVLPSGQYTAFSFDIDATDLEVGEELFLRYRVKYCCDNVAVPGFPDHEILGAYTSVKTAGGCALGTNFNANITPIDLSSSISYFGPTFLNSNQSGTFNLFLDNVPDIDLFDDVGQVCIEVTANTAINYVLGSAIFRDQFGGDYANVDITSETVTNIGDEVITQICFNNYYEDGSSIKFDLAYDCDPAFCGTTVISNIKLGYRHGFDCPVEDCFIVFDESNFRTRLGAECCPETLECIGLNTVNAFAQRSCFGLPDNDADGCGDPGGALNENAIRLERAMYGDALEFVSEAHVNIPASSSISNFAHAFFELLPLANIEIAGDLTVTVTDASEGTEYTSLLSLDGSSTQVVDLSVTILSANGNIPVGFVYEDDDEIIIEGEFINLGNPGCQIQQVDIPTDWYLSPGPDPAVSGKFRCGIPLEISFLQVGHALTARPFRNSSFGCGGVEFGYRIDYCLGNGTFGSVPFPNEIRNTMKPLRSGIRIPEGLTLQEIVVEQSRFSQYFNQPQIPIFNIDMTPFVNINGDFAEFDWADYFQECGPESAPNGGYQFWIIGRFDQSCEASPSSPEWYFEAEPNYCSDVPFPNVLIDSLINEPLKLNLPLLELEVSAQTTRPADRNAEWGFSVLETEGIAVENVWMALYSPSGSIAPVSIRSLDDTIYSSTGIFALEDLDIGEIIGYNMLAEYNSCVKDSLLALIGWACDGIPTSVNQALSGQATCKADSVWFFIEPRDGVIQQEIIQQPNGVVEACAAALYEIEITNVSVTTLYDPILEVFLPYTEGMEFEGVEELCYPCDPDNPVYNYSMPPPAQILATPQGIKNVWLLKDIIPSFAENSNIGWVGQSQPTEALTKLRLRFTIETTCDHISGDFLRVRTKATSFCGGETQTLLQNASQLVIEGVEIPYQSNLSLDIGNIEYNGCDPNSTLDLIGQLFFFDATDNADSLFVTLPPSFVYNGTEMDPAFFNNVEPEIELITLANSPIEFQVLKFGIKGDIPALTFIPFKINLTSQPEQVLCDDENLLILRTVRSGQVDCNGVTCSILGQSGYYSQPMNIKKDDFIAVNIEVETSCGLSEARVRNMQISNLGTTDMVEDLVLNLYYDADESGDVTPGDEWVKELVFSDDVPVGEIVSFNSDFFPIEPTKSCRLVANIDGCTCTAQEVSINYLSAAIAGGNVVSCPEAIVPVGCDADLRPFGFQYEWVGVSPAPLSVIVDPSAPQTVLDFTGITDFPDTMIYVLALTHPGSSCLSFDTMTVVLTDNIEITGPTIVECEGAAFQLSGPAGFNNYQWTPSAGLDNSNVSNPTGIAASGITPFVLTYNDENNCDVTFYQDVNTDEAGACGYVSGVIWQDLNGDGLQQNDELLLENILVYLFDADTGEIIDSMFTNATGMYEFEFLPEANYYIGIDEFNQGIFTYIGSPFQVGPDNIDSDLDPSSYLSGEFSIVPGGDALEVDGGLIPIGIMGGLVWNDINENGTYDAGETFITGVSVTISNAIGEEMETVENGSDGTFQFDSLIVGAYVFTFSLPELGPGLCYLPTIALQGNVNEDSGILNNDFETPNLYFDPRLGPNLTHDYGFVQAGSIGDIVWVDVNENGLRDEGESGVEGFEVILFNELEEPLDTAYTDASGRFIFEKRRIGNYKLLFNLDAIASNIYAFTSFQVASTLLVNSDALSTGYSELNFLDPYSGENLSINAGLVLRNQIGDFVWLDENTDGIQDPGELGLADVKVLLYSNGQVVDSTITNANGFYSFSLDTPTGLQLQFIKPTGATSYTFSPFMAGVDPEIDNDVTNQDGFTQFFNYNPLNGPFDHIDAGLFGCQEIEELPLVIGNPVICGEDSLILASGNIPANGILEYFWSDQEGNAIGTDSILSISFEDLVGVDSIFLQYSVDGCLSQESSPMVLIISEKLEATIMGKDTFCENTSIKLFTTPATNVAHTWYYYIPGNTPPVSLIQTADTIEIFGLSAGEHQFIMEAENQFGCISEPDTATILVAKISELETDATIFTACVGESISLPIDIEFGLSDSLMLNMEFLGGEFFLDTVATNSYMLTLDNLQAIDAGNYALYGYSFDACRSNTLYFQVNVIDPSQFTESMAGADFDACNNQAISLGATLPTGAQGIWSQSQEQENLGVEISDTLNPNTLIGNINLDGNYTFYWTLSSIGCFDYSIDSIVVNVSTLPNINALAQASNNYLCPAENLVLTGNDPIIGTGLWTTNGTATIADPQEAITPVTNLPIGENVFYWTLSNGVCLDYSSDSVEVEGAPTFGVANDFFDVIGNGASIGLSLFNNDNLANLEGYTFNIVEGPKYGTANVIAPGEIDYFSLENETQNDTLIYEVCSVVCTEDCYQALAVFQIVRDVVDCWVPNYLTPNGDGMNDLFVIPCLEDFDESRILIYNRWGDLVFEEEAYDNDWDGNRKGKVLPAGTYFYVLMLGPDSDDIKEGYLTLIR